MLFSPMLCLIEAIPLRVNASIKPRASCSAPSNYLE
jgi:hypothetical protein